MLEKGKRVGEYVLLEKLGAGGFGEVWKAEKRTEFSTSYFAIKFFRPKDDEEIDVSAVKREVGTWQSLNGLPNIISVIEANRFEDYVYIVSEFAEGGSLDRWLKANGGKAHSTEEAVKITQQILQGLEGMHGEGFVHRDLKPANVLLKRNIFYLADFGISRQMKTHSKTTGTAGTYEFMPPEAFEKNPSVSVHTDIWAAGAILQKLLTGHLPFPQDEIPSLMAAILMSEPEPLPETVPFELRGIVKKALQKKREDRFQSANEMREALQNALIQPKIVESQTPLQAQTLVLEDSDRTEKYKIAPTEDLNETETQIRNPQKIEETKSFKNAEAETNLKEESNQNRLTLQKLFQLSGIVPLGIFFLIHIFTNSKAMNGERSYNEAILESNQIPFLLVVEFFGVFLPLIFHSIYGMFLSTKTGLIFLNQEYRNRWFYYFQRVSGIFLFIFILFHLLHFRFGLLGGFGLAAIPVAGNEAKAFVIVSSDFQVVLVLIIYILGVLATSWHLAYGIFSFSINWKILVNRESQKLAFKICTGIAILLSAIGINTIFAFSRPCGLLPRFFCEEEKKGIVNPSNTSPKKF